MSAKSRKRNRRLAALAGVITAGTLAAKNKRNASIDKGIKSAEDDSGSDMLSKKTNYITKKDTSKSDVAPVAKKEAVPVGKMRGAGTDASAIAGQKTRADYAQSKRAEQADETSVGNYPTNTYIKPYNKSRTRGGAKDGGRMGLKSGGRAKGCGKALRGFGKAMKGNR